HLLPTTAVTRCSTAFSTDSLLIGATHFQISTPVVYVFYYEHLHSPYERNTKPFYEQRLQDMITEAIEFFCFFNKSPKNSDNEFIWRNFVANASHGFITPECTQKLFWERATVLSETVLNAFSADASNRIARFYRFFDMVVKQNADASREFLDYYPYMAKMLFVVYILKIKKTIFEINLPNYVMHSHDEVLETIKYRCYQIKSFISPVSYNMWKLFLSTYLSEIFSDLGMC
ncbi:hypothetical protein TYRP_015870, partial [Tyrophagus putrescentiae]